MIYQLPSNNLYGDRPIPISIPDSWDVHIYEIAGFHRPGLSADAIEERVRCAIGTKPIHEGA